MQRDDTHIAADLVFVRALGLISEARRLRVKAKRAGPRARLMLHEAADLHTQHAYALILNSAG